MIRTSLSRCFKLALVALLVFAVIALPASAAAVGSEDVPEEAEVGSKVTATVTLTELYKNPQLEQWVLAGETDLKAVTWTVTYYDQTGSKVGQDSYDGENFTGAAVNAADGTSEVQVKVTGTVPSVREYSYDPMQSFRVMELHQTREGGSSDTIRTWEANHFTSDSDRARSAIESAESAIAGASGANTADAESLLERAIDAYEGGNFDNAENLAADAEKQANEAAQSNQTMQLAMYAAGGLAVLGLLGGGFLWYRNQQDGYDKLG